MKYNEQIFNRVKEELDRRHNDAYAVYNSRLDEMRDKAPEIAKLSDNLVETSYKIMQAILAKDGKISENIEKIRRNNLKTQATIKRLLVEFGYDADYLEIPFTCKKCKDTGFVMGKRCGCFDELLKKYAVMEVNSSSKIALMDFDEFKLDYYPLSQNDGYSPREQMQEVFDFCKKYAADFSTNSPSLFLTGRTGLGKTFLSSCIAKSVIEKGYSVVFDNIQNIIRKVENEHFGREEGDTMAVLAEADLLILDDLGSEFVTNFSSSFVYNILNDRINLEKPLIISTNFSNKELNKIYNDRIISRISSFIPLHFSGNDIRQIILQNKFKEE